MLAGIIDITPLTFVLDRFLLVLGSPAAFQNLNFIQSTLQFYNNGGSTAGLNSFCNSARQFFCPASSTLTTPGQTAGRWANNNIAYDAFRCCTTFCTSSTTC